MKTLARLAAVLAALALCAGAHAQSMYKWVDEKGVTHYSSDPPPDGKGQKIEVKPAPPSSPAQPQPLRLEDVRKRALELRDERLAKEKREDDAKKREEQQRSRCLRAQNDLEMLRRQRRIYSMNERGERVYMDDKGRAEEMEKSQKAVDTYCR